MITKIDDMLADWYQWTEAYSRQGLGFPGNYKINPVRGDQPAGPIIPLMDIPRRLRKIDQAMRDISPKFIVALEARYLHSGNDQARSRYSGLPVGTYRTRVHDAHTWIDGYISHKISA